MVFTVEPVLNAGAPGVEILSDGWTAVTRDSSPSAQFEHTIGVSETGAKVFTLSARERGADIGGSSIIVRTEAGARHRTGA